MAFASSRSNRRQHTGCLAPVRRQKKVCFLVLWPAKRDREEGVRPSMSNRSSTTITVALRQRRCRAPGCGRYFALCPGCDRGQAYCCEGCRQWARRQQRRAAGTRYQQSERGRLAHRRRQSAYRERGKHVRRDASSLRCSRSRRLPRRPLPEGAGARCLLCLCPGHIAGRTLKTEGRGRARPGERRKQQMALAAAVTSRTA